MVPLIVLAFVICGALWGVTMLACWERRLLIPALAGVICIFCNLLPALAGELNSETEIPGSLPYGFTCDQVRSFVNVHGRFKALAWAVEQGATVGQIAAARRCLSAPPITTSK